jgi:NAD(P)-dependent dehydrogenase (short-subunit alcohol dehydrogenase family)
VSPTLEPLFSLAGRVAVVTGGSSGLGRPLSIELADAGAAVVLVGRDRDRLAQAPAGIEARGGQASWVAVDLANRGALLEAAERATAPFGEPDVLVNAAGINLRPPLPCLTDQDWDLTISPGSPSSWPARPRLT